MTEWYRSSMLGLNVARNHRLCWSQERSTWNVRAMFVNTLMPSIFVLSCPHAERPVTVASNAHAVLAKGRSWSLHVFHLSNNPQMPEQTPAILKHFTPIPLIFPARILCNESNRPSLISPFSRTP